MSLKLDAAAKRGEGLHWDESNRLTQQGNDAV
jgi:hypothetical protein